MIKFNVINKRISVLLLSGVILCSYGCNMKTNSDESVESSIIDEHSLDSNFDTTSESGKVIVSNIDTSTNNEISGTKLSIINEQGYGIKKVYILLKKFQKDLAPSKVMTIWHCQISN